VIHHSILSPFGLIFFRRAHHAVFIALRPPSIFALGVDPPSQKAFSDSCFLNFSPSPRRSYPPNLSMIRPFPSLPLKALFDASLKHFSPQGKMFTSFIMPSFVQFSPLPPPFWEFTLHSSEATAFSGLNRSLPNSLIKKLTSENGFVSVPSPPTLTFYPFFYRVWLIF